MEKIPVLTQNGKCPRIIFGYDISTAFEDNRGYILEIRKMEYFKFCASRNALIQSKLMGFMTKNSDELLVKNGVIKMVACFN